MSAFKRLKKADVTTLPYVANKQWRFENEQLLANSIIMYSASYQSTRFDLNNDPTNSGEYSRLLFDSINHLYYHQFSGSYLDPTSLNSSLLYESASIHRPSGSYYNYFPKYHFRKSFPTGSHEEIKIISIPNEIYGLGIKPGSYTQVQGDSSKYFFTDDGFGNVLNNGSDYVGNIFYEHGIIVITDSGIGSLVDNNIVITFKNNHIIFEKSVKCSVKDYEMNYSYNKTLLTSGSITELSGFATGSTFSPYITMVGLYNDSNDLLAVAKFSQPVPTSLKTDFTAIVKLDF